MNAVLVGSVVAVCVFGAGMGVLYFHPLLPAPHRTKDTQETVRLGIAMLSVLSSLVLGLLIASAKGSWDSTDGAVRAYAGQLVLLDETLRDYGDEALEARGLLRDYTRRMMADMWPAGDERTASVRDIETAELLETLRERIRALPPRDDGAKWLLEQGLGTHAELTRQRWRLLAQTGPAVRPIVLVILVSWIMAIFASFGLNAPRNATVIAAFLVCSLAIGGSVFLILEMDTPFEGVLSVSDEPMRLALHHMLDRR